MRRALSSQSVHAVIVQGKDGSVVYLAVDLTKAQVLDAIARGFGRGSLVMVTSDREYVASD
jgi:hypothetical protein